MTETSTDTPKNKETDKVIKQLSAKINKEPKNAGHFLKRAQQYFKKEEYEKCFNDAKHALDLDESLVDAAVLGGEAATKCGKFQGAHSIFSIGLKQNKKDENLIQGLKKLQRAIVNSYDTEDTTEQGYNAVDLCTQSPYPGDDQLLNLEKEILDRRHDIREVSRLPKKEIDPDLRQRAAQAAMAGHKSMIAGKFPDALESFTYAVDIETDNIILRRLRAEVFFINQDPVSAMKDLMHIQKPERTADAWKLGGKLLMEFKLPVLAEFWLRKASELAKSKDEETAICFQKVRAHRLYDPLTKDMPVTVDFTMYGKAVFAVKDIKAGDIVFSDAPIVTTPYVADDKKQVVKGCNHCGTSLMTARDYFKEKLDNMDATAKEVVENNWPVTKPVVCSECKLVTYCSNICKNTAWERHHELLCPSRSKATKKLYDIDQNKGWGTDVDGTWKELWSGHFSAYILAKIWANIAADVKLWMKQDGKDVPEMMHWAKAKAPFRKFIAFGVGSAAKDMPYVLKIMNDIFRDCGDGIKMDITEQELNGRYYQAACNLQIYSDPVTPYHKFYDNLSNFNPEDPKALSILKYLDDKIPSASFSGMFPLHACLNHSCMNNVEVSDGEVNGVPGVSVRAKTDIKEGEELTTTYIDTTMPRRLRRAWMYKSFNFWCQCPRCQFEGDDAYSCTNCKKRAGDAPFKGCGKCHRGWYCSSECQKINWKEGHKLVCGVAHSKADYS
ncbi:uncharacterized protein LOC134721815 [Mytilus trossulus]|uniref:uncharacterized protein LOC134721815 n=1 Tax=Mytilus trossulus TaxID=6551 RepID=UPI0030051358